MFGFEILKQQLHWLLVVVVVVTTSHTDRDSFNVNLPSHNFCLHIF